MNKHALGWALIGMMVFILIMGVSIAMIIQGGTEVLLGLVAVAIIIGIIFLASWLITTYNPDGTLRDWSENEPDEPTEIITKYDWQLDQFRQTITMGVTDARYTGDNS